MFAFGGGYIGGQVVIVHNMLGGGAIVESGGDSLLPQYHHYGKSTARYVGDDARLRRYLNAVYDSAYHEFGDCLYVDNGGNVGADGVRLHSYVGITAGIAESTTWAHVQVQGKGTNTAAPVGTIEFFNGSDMISRIGGVPDISNKGQVSLYSSNGTSVERTFTSRRGTQNISWAPLIVESDSSSVLLQVHDPIVLGSATLGFYVKNVLVGLVGGDNVDTCKLKLSCRGSVGIGAAVAIGIDGADRVRLKGGTSLVSGDITLSAGWGAGATVAVSGTDQRGTITVTTDAADTPSANPTVTLTFKDGSWGSTPIAVANMDHSSTGPSTAPVTCTTSATSLILSYRGTPTATTALTYKFNYIAIG